MEAIRGHGVPAGTVVVNVSGSLVLGMLVGWAMRHGGASEEVKAVLGTGFLGGYTTFSTASVEAARLVRGGRPTGALLHALLMVGLSLVAVAVWVHRREDLAVSFELRRRPHLRVQSAPVVRATPEAVR